MPNISLASFQISWISILLSVFLTLILPLAIYALHLFDKKIVEKTTANNLGRINFEQYAIIDKKTAKARLTIVFFSLFPLTTLFHAILIGLSFGNAEIGGSTIEIAYASLGIFLASIPFSLFVLYHFFWRKCKPQELRKSFLEESLVIQDKNIQFKTAKIQKRYEFQLKSITKNFSSYAERDDLSEGQKRQLLMKQIYRIQVFSERSTKSLGSENIKTFEVNGIYLPLTKINNELTIKTIYEFQKIFARRKKHDEKFL